MAAIIQEPLAFQVNKETMRAAGKHTRVSFAIAIYASRVRFDRCESMNLDALGPLDATCLPIPPRSTDRLFLREDICVGQCTSVYARGQASPSETYLPRIQAYPRFRQITAPQRSVWTTQLTRRHVDTCFRSNEEYTRRSTLPRVSSRPP